MSDSEVWESSRPRPGRRFVPTHELALHAQAVEISRDLRGAERGLLLVREFAGPIGVPDLTALVGHSRLLEARLSHETPPLINEVDAAVTATAHTQRPKSADAIARTLGWPSETILRRIPGLIRSGALLPAGPKTFTRPEALQPVGQIVAIEAKVKDWRKALAQVRSYRVWADNYVIVIGALARPLLAQLRSEVVQDSAGLVVDGRWVVRPRKRVLSRAKRLWASEHLVAAMTGDVHQPSSAP